MQLTYVPLLQQQRELYRRPRDRKRFRAYLHMTLDFRTNRVRLPTRLNVPSSTTSSETSATYGQAH